MEVAVNDLHTRWSLYYWSCSFSWVRIVCDRATTGELWPPNTPHRHFPRCHFVNILSITWKLWPVEIYQACSIQIRTSETKCGCGVGVSRSGCGKTLNTCPFKAHIHTATFPDPIFWKDKVWQVSYCSKYTLEIFAVMKKIKKFCTLNKCYPQIHCKLFERNMSSCTYMYFKYAKSMVTWVPPSL